MSKNHLFILLRRDSIRYAFTHPSIHHTAFTFPVRGFAEISSRYDVQNGIDLQSAPETGSTGSLVVSGCNDVSKASPVEKSGGVRENFYF